MSNDKSLQAVGDFVSVIRRTFGPTMSGRDLAAQMIRDLILLGSLPAYVDHIDEWWLVSSARDWLLESDGAVSLRNFRQIVHFPDAGREACRSEILLTAFADAVATRRVGEELVWISGSQQEMPGTVVEHISRSESGRIVVFRLNKV